jgi:hypothetical protein
MPALIRRRQPVTGSRVVTFLAEWRSLARRSVALPATSSLFHAGNRKL